MARKSIVHPNRDDLKVLDVILGLGKTENVLKSEVVEKSGLEKSVVNRSMGWLLSQSVLESSGKGRGTSYKVLVTENKFELADPASEQYRKVGGPTVNAMVRAVFNELSEGEKVSPADVMAKAQKMFPDSGLTRSSFGQVFSKAAKNGELFFENEGRARVYWRGSDKLAGAAQVESRQEEQQQEQQETG